MRDGGFSFFPVGGSVLQSKVEKPFFSFCGQRHIGGDSVKKRHIGEMGECVVGQVIGFEIGIKL